ncbi:hypothetical protein TEA_029862 [Camellia sinensis var. sinensis]|uniref:Uncharacterized protein n=1 Tax=Camellia sinensis var. sinensis TaxID=542762 RepID=A0A4S4EX54_CAMSN|nr:hypothetical protein TEA_029862 [Camellia sinensis var. sinensis]
MESLGGFGFSEMGRTVRKKRSNSSRRPRNDSQPLPDYRDNSSLSSTSPSDDVSRISSDDNDGHGTNYWKKELNLNQCSSKASATNLVEGETTLKISNEDAGCRESDGAHIKSNSEWEHSGIDSKRRSEGVLAPANWKSVSKVKGLELQSRTIDAQISRRISDTYTSGPSGQSEVASDGAASDNKVKKVKLKVGGVTRTIHTKSMSVGASLGGSSSMKYSHSSDASRPRKKLILQSIFVNNPFNVEYLELDLCYLERGSFRVRDVQQSQELESQRQTHAQTHQSFARIIHPGAIFESATRNRKTSSNWKSRCPTNLTHKEDSRTPATAT